MRHLAAILAALFAAGLSLVVLHLTHAQGAGLWVGGGFAVLALAFAVPAELRQALDTLKPLLPLALPKKEDAGAGQ